MQQGKGLIKIIAIAFGLASLYQLSFTFISSKFESNAQNFAIQTTNVNDENYFESLDFQKKKYLDSIGDKKFLGFTYNSSKQKELNKGLDLKGGINVILQVSVKDILKGLAENSRSVIFNKALENADELQKESDDTYVESFFKSFDAIKGDLKLASPEIFANRTLSDEVNFNMTDNEVKPIIVKKIDASITSAFEVLRKRIDKFGVTQPNIQRLGNSGRILVELPGANDVERVQKLLQSTAQLEFWEQFQTNRLMFF